MRMVGGFGSAGAGNRSGRRTVTHFGVAQTALVRTAQTGRREVYTRPGDPTPEELRDAIIELLVAEYKGEPESVESYAYEHPVRIDGQVINVAYGSSGNYVSVSIPRDATDRTLLEAIAKRLDAVIATGKYDALFGK